MMVLCCHPFLWYPISLPVDRSLGEGADGSFGCQCQLPRGYEALGSLQVRSHKGVALDERNVSPDTLAYGAGCVAWLQGVAEVESLGRAGRFDGEDA